MGAKSAAPPPSCYDKAVELLARRPHFRAQLAAKLERRGYSAEEIAETLARLAGQGYLDDAATAAGVVAARRGGEGRSRLRFELERRGAPKEAVEEALGALSEDDLEQTRAAARSWLSRRPARRPPALRTATDAVRRELAALARHLARKGFSQRAIFAVLKQRPADSDDAADPPDPDNAVDSADLGAPAEPHDPDDSAREP
ncbi:MAG TPA: regulatory protein RecX [Thermoanaerobaculia bacterium]|nr:regulatory protein RecX [Thermoanaerobaculia bacterium]